MGKVSRALNKANTEIIPEGNDSPSPEINDQVLNDNVSSPKNIKPIQDIPNAETATVPPATEKWDERLIIATENFSSVAESFRKLRTLILHPESGKPARSILVVSATAQEGKTFACANLGVSLAHGVDQKALIMDCDLRRPSLHNLFGLKNNQGLADYLTGNKELSKLIHRTQLPNLTILPAGPPPDNPSELLSSDKAAILIKEAINRYDDRVVILDCPPLLAASETIVLTKLVDKIVLVVRWGKSGRDEIKRAVEQIGREKIIGVVFNAFEMNILDRKVQDVGYYNYYSESYY